MVNFIWQPGMTLEEVEKQAILQAFRFFRSNKTATASALGVSVRTIDTKLDKYLNDDKTGEEHDRARAEHENEWLRRSRNGHGDKAQPALSVAQSQSTDEGDGGGNGSSSEGEEWAEARDVSGAESGVRVESAQKAPEKHAVPVHQREEVQGLPPKSITPRSNGSRR